MQHFYTPDGSLRLKQPVQSRTLELAGLGRLNPTQRQDKRPRLSETLQQSKQPRHLSHLTACPDTSTLNRYYSKTAKLSISSHRQAKRSRLASMLRAKKMLLKTTRSSVDA